MKKILKSVTGAAVAALLLGAGPAQAEALKLRLSVESTPGSATQHMLASFRDALKAEMGDAVLRSSSSTAAPWATRSCTCSRYAPDSST